MTPPPSRKSVHPPDHLVAAVIAAGGTGKRMNAGIPKQFVELAGKPILLHAIESLASLDDIAQIVVALPPEHIPEAEVILRHAPPRVEIRCVAGGRNRQDSVHNGVRQIRADAAVIMVHDAVRPLCGLDVMARVLDAARNKGAAVPGLPATETIQRVSRHGRVLATPPREELYAIQTPQAFRADVLRSALERARAEGFIGTDESSVVRRAGHSVFVVTGSPDNIKITRPQDLDLAAILLSKRRLAANEVAMNHSGFRIGQGIDYHRLVEGRKLIMGGVDIPWEKGLEGHSDADVVTHAVCDAILGAAGLGDIGAHFPDTDPAHRGRSSLDFLQEIREKIESDGWTILNVDATIVAQKPKFAPHAALMRRNIARSLGLKETAINIKATTTEGMNAEGRGEGISAQAIALINKNQQSVVTGMAVKLP
ncbi:MAG TPA: 2-C-methyl-D-erythritol 4-phosphate cytidylyltransferase [Acidobacteriota bacterium]|nr:2-C-methyl-D-erythritol 4-phosphate cytidylyltransferase [Acidobacteriota bacterium]